MKINLFKENKEMFTHLLAIYLMIKITHILITNYDKLINEIY